MDYGVYKNERLAYGILFDKPYLPLNINAIKIFGVEAAIILTNFVMEEQHFRILGKLQNNYFCSDIKQRTENTGLAYHKQVMAIKMLCKIGVLITKEEKSVRSYRISHHKLLKLLENPSNVQHRKVKVEALEIMQYWKDIRIDGTRLPQPQAQHKSTVAKRAIDIISKVLTVGYKEIPILTQEQIKIAIDKHALEALDNEYLPMIKTKETLRNMNVAVFFWNSYVGNNHGYKSRCLHLLKNEPKKRSENRAILEPTNEIAKIAADRLLSIYSSKEGELRAVDRNKIIKASNMLYQFHKRHRLSEMQPAYELVDSLINAVTEYFKGTVHIGNLCSEYTFNQILPNYLKEMGELN